MDQGCLWPLMSKISGFGSQRNLLRVMVQSSNAKVPVLLSSVSPENLLNLVYLQDILRWETMMTRYDDNICISTVTVRLSTWALSMSNILHGKNDGHLKSIGVECTRFSDTSICPITRRKGAIELLLGVPWPCWSLVKVQEKLMARKFRFSSKRLEPKHQHNSTQMSSLATAKWVANDWAILTGKQTFIFFCTVSKVIARLAMVLGFLDT